MKIPKVWNRRDPNTPKNAVYVGRPTKWGNPFIVGKDGKRGECCVLFETNTLPTLDVTELKGKDLVCWCAPNRCHADALLEKANSE